MRLWNTIAKNKKALLLGGSAFLALAAIVTTAEPDHARCLAEGVLLETSPHGSGQTMLNYFVNTLANTVIRGDCFSVTDANNNIFEVCDVSGAEGAVNIVNGVARSMNI